MGYTRLSVDPDGYTDAAAKATAAVAHLETAGQHALKSLSGLAHMGGDDEAGGKFAHAYDKQAAGIFDGLGALCTALVQVAAAFEVSAASHAAAEAANSTGMSAPAPVVQGSTVAIAVDFAHPASANGGTNIFPQGWTFIQDLVSATWPDGDTGKMRRAKTAFHALADDIDHASASYIATLLDPLQGFQAPDIAAITDATSTLAPAAKGLADACRELGDGCGEYADAVDKAHEEAGNELVEFVITTAAAIGISVLLTPITAGVSDLVGGAAVAADAAITAGEVGTTLATMAARVAPMLVRLGQLSRVGAEMATMTARLTSLGAKAVIFGGRSVAIGTVWGAASAYADVLVDPDNADPVEDLKYSVAAGFFVEGGSVAGELISKAATTGMSGAARAATKIASEEIPEAVGEPAVSAPLSGPKHAAVPKPVVVKVTEGAIKTTTYLAGAGAGSVAGQTITTGVDPESLPSDIVKDATEGKIPILEAPPKHVAFK